MKLSSRVLNMQESPIRKLVPFADEAKKKGIKVFHLNIGQPDIETPDVFWKKIKNFNQKVLSYSHSQGIKEYIKSTVKYYERFNIRLKEEEIMITTGGSEAILFAMLACAEYGDEIIVFEPFYTNYNGFASVAGVKLVPVTTYAENGFDIPENDEIEKYITDKTKAILICNPNNPTGTVYSKEKLEALIELAKKHDLFILSDEVYREFTYDGKTHTSIMHFEGIEDRAVLLDSISKRYSACGARLGCLASKNEELIKNVMKIAQARLCAPTLDQIGASALNEELDETYFDQVRREYQKRRDIVMEYLKKDPEITCLTPGGAFYIIAKLPIKDSNHFAKWLLTDFSIDEKTTMIAPASGFYATKGLGNDEIRIAYILNENDLKQAMEILLEGLKKYKTLF